MRSLRRGSVCRLLATRRVLPREPSRPDIADPDSVSSVFDLLVETLRRIGRPDLFQCSTGKSAKAVISSAASCSIVPPWGAGGQYAGNGVELLANVGSVGLGEISADRRGHDLRGPLCREPASAAPVARATTAATPTTSPLGVAHYAPALRAEALVALVSSITRPRSPETSAPSIRRCMPWGFTDLRTRRRRSAPGARA